MRQTGAMVEIGSPQKLQDWLGGKPPQLAAAIASRIALRVLPLALADRTGSGQAAARRLTLAVFRANTISRSARTYPDREIAAFAAYAARAYAADAAAYAAAGSASRQAVYVFFAAELLKLISKCKGAARGRK